MTRTQLVQVLFFATDAAENAREIKQLFQDKKT
jgi:hypothetical protein